MGETIFVFGERRTLNIDNIIFISKEHGDYDSLETYLRNFKKRDPYHFTKNHLNIKYFSDEDTFISTIHDNPLVLRLEQNLIPRDSLVITGEDLDLEDIIVNKFNYEDTDYDIFSGEKVEVYYKDTVFFVIEELINCLNQMLLSGYLDLKNIDKIDDWIVTFQEPVFDILIRYHKLETSAGDITTCDEFLTNPEFRKTICIIIMKILANFLINNNLLLAKTVKKYSGWMNPDLWYYIKNEIKMNN